MLEAFGRVPTDSPTIAAARRERDQALEAFVETASRTFTRKTISGPEWSVLRSKWHAYGKRIHVLEVAKRTATHNSN